jgi:hypothetical protein
MTRLGSGSATGVAGLGKTLQNRGESFRTKQEQMQQDQAASKGE